MRAYRKKILPDLCFMGSERKIVGGISDMSKFQKLKDYSTEIGKKYNHLTITGFTKKPDLRKGCNITYAICECELCGNKNYEGILSDIKAGKIKSCCGRDFKTKKLSDEYAELYFSKSKGAE